MSRKRIWMVIVSVMIFSGAYTYYVKKDREAGIKKYLPRPQVGDIYKMQKDTREGVAVFYLKVKDIGVQSIYFYPGLTSSGAANDIYLKNFDTAATEVYSRKELIEIAAGEWDLPDRDRTNLLEIERK